MSRALAALAAPVLLATGLAAGLTSAVASPASAAQQQGAPSADTSVTLTGRGFGHGHGMSQYGALGRAQAGQAYGTIIKHYYPHTAWGKASGRLRVLITEDTTTDVKVGARRGLTLKSLGSGKTWTLPAKREGHTVGKWRIRPASGHRSEVDYLTGAWHPWHTVAGDAQFASSSGPVRLYLPYGHADYRGALRSVSVNSSGTKRDTVNLLALDAYVRGVVAREMPASWPANAVRAQAVAARTYAAYERQHPMASTYDICDTAHCQVYGGADAEQPQSDAAVAKTAGRIVTYGGSPAFAQFSASNGGWSADGGQPYLVAAQDTYDRYPSWTATFTGRSIAKHWPGLGTLQKVTVDARDGNGAYGGRATQVTVTGDQSSVTVSGETFATYLGLRSTLFKVS